MTWRPKARSESPCYDLCMCRGCWPGWTSYPLRTLVRWRIEYIWYNAPVLRRIPLFKRKGRYR